MSLGYGAAPGPDFLCIGAQKAGTQWLYDQLQWHPEFWMPPVKELHYLDRGNFAKRRRAAVSLRARARFGLPLLNASRERKRYRRLERRDIDFLVRYIALLADRDVDLDGYGALFEGKGASIAGDVTPGYARIEEPEVARFAARFPRTRILYLARDPIDRLWSHLMMTARRTGGIDKVTPGRAVRFAARPVVRLRCTNTEVVRRWRAHVPAERFGLFFFDDIRDDPARARHDILRFLGADPGRPSGPLPPGFNRKGKERKARMPEAVRAALVEAFADELRASAAAFGGPAEAWAARYGV